METITDIRQMQQWADATRSRGQRIGFVPTMGYLHAGHLNLVRAARSHSDVVVASIFVNPLQFGTNEDLERYPRDVRRDTAMLSDVGTDVLFLPEAAGVYPPGFQTTVTVERVTRGLCGAARPTHFAGVTTIVAKLFHMVKPHVAVFGCKDFQQLVAIRKDDVFLARPALRPLRHADQSRVVQPLLGQHLGGHRDLAPAAVDDEQIGRGKLAGDDAPAAAGERLARRRVVVATDGRGHVEAPVLAGLHGQAVEDHAGGDGALAHRVRDIETFDPLCRFRQS